MANEELRSFRTVTFESAAGAGWIIVAEGFDEGFLLDGAITASFFALSSSAVALLTGTVTVRSPVNARPSLMVRPRFPASRELSKVGSDFWRS